MESGCLAHHALDRNWRCLEIKVVPKGHDIGLYHGREEDGNCTCWSRAIIRVYICVHSSSYLTCRGIQISQELIPRVKDGPTLSVGTEERSRLNVESSLVELVRAESPVSKLSS